jgi:hypothetical protein
MQLIYNSESFAVMHFVAVPRAATVAEEGAAAAATAMADAPALPGLPDPGGFEIVDKHARKEIFLQGAVAESFQRGVKALVDQGEDPQALEDYIACYTVLAQQPVLLH